MINFKWNLDDAKEAWKEEAEEEVAEKIAEKMLLKDKPIDEIIEFTELTEAKILEIKKKLEI